MKRARGTAFWLATAGVAWAAGFTIWALTAPVYEPGGETFLEANGEPAILVALLAPLAVSVLVWVALHVACRDANRAARTIGLTAAAVLVAFSVLTGFTIGTFVVPGAIALTAAAVLTPVVKTS